MLKKIGTFPYVSSNCCTFAAVLDQAQMAESVDALVSNTSGATHPGSIPGLGTNKREVNASLLSYPGPYFNLTPSNALPLVAWRPSGTALARILASPQYVLSRIFFLVLKMHLRTIRAFTFHIIDHYNLAKI